MCCSLCDISYLQCTTCLMTSWWCLTAASCSMAHARRCAGCSCLSVTFYHAKGVVNVVNALRSTLLSMPEDQHCLASSWALGVKSSRLRYCATCAAICRHVLLLLHTQSSSGGRSLAAAAPGLLSAKSSVCKIRRFVSSIISNDPLIPSLS